MSEKISIKQFSLCAFLALASTISIENLLKVNQEQHTISNSIFSLFAFVAIYVLWKNILPKLNIRLVLISEILGTIFSAFMVLGKNSLIYDSTKLDRVETFVNIILAAPLFAGVVASLILSTEKINESLRFDVLDNGRLGHISSKHWFWISFGLIILAWLPGIVASYPGVYGYDSVFQMEYYESGIISLHHPLLHTYLLGFCIDVMGDLLGSPERGFFVYTAFQMICVSVAFASICKYMVQRKLCVFFRLIFLAVFMFLPVNTIMAMSSTKDVLYGVSVVFLIILFFQLLEKKQLLHDRIFCAKFIIAAFFNMAFRNQGIYVFVFGMVFSVVLLRKEWKKLTAIGIVCLIIYGIYAGPLTKLMGGQPESGVQEMMSIPIVQLSRAMLYDNETLSAKEKNEIEQYIPDYENYSYSEALSDPIKNTFNSQLFKENPLHFLKLWISVGLKTPISYIDAFARITIGLWYPDMNYHDPQVYHPYWEYLSTQQNESGTWKIINRETPKRLQWLADFYYDITYNNSYQNIPIISMLFSSGILIWIVFLYIAKYIYIKRYEKLIPAFFLFGLWGTLLLGPVVLYRYIFPIAISVPTLICSIVTKDKERV